MRAGLEGGRGCWRTPPPPSWNSRVRGWSAVSEDRQGRVNRSLHRGTSQIFTFCSFSEFFCSFLYFLIVCMLHLSWTSFLAARSGARPCPTSPNITGIYVLFIFLYFSDRLYASPNLNRRYIGIQIQCEGAGRTLNERDLCQVRNVVWWKTVLLDWSIEFVCLLKKIVHCAWSGVNFIYTCKMCVVLLIITTIYELSIWTIRNHWTIWYGLRI